MNLGYPHVFIIVRVTLSLTSERDGNCICGIVGHEVQELRNKPSVFCVELPFLHWDRLLLLRFSKTRVYKIITPFIVHSRYDSVLFVGLKLPLCAMLGTVSPRFNQICFLTIGININCNPMLFCLFCMSL